jgi:hypothetical protein
MTDALPPESRMAASTLSEIETRKCTNVTVVEALAFAQVLSMSLARLLPAEDGQQMAPVWWAGYGPEGVRPWLATGTGFDALRARRSRANRPPTTNAPRSKNFGAGNWRDGPKRSHMRGRPATQTI